MQYIQWIIQLLLIPVVAPLAVGIINSLKAKMVKRNGPSIFQPYRNLSKMFHKDEVISHDASWVTRVAPFLIFGATLVIGASIPLFSTSLHLPTSDLLAIVYLLAFGTFFLALSGIDAGSAFGGFGSSREMTISAIAEGSLILSTVPLAFLAHSTDLYTIVTTVASRHTTIVATLVLAFIGFIIVLLAETKRYPFDNPDTHLELTMIHEAMILDYSGKRLALMEWSAAMKLFIFSALAVNLFWPIGMATGTGLLAILTGIGWLFVKVFAICAAIAILESVIAKYRFFRLPDLLLIAFILSAVAIGLVL